MLMHKFKVISLDVWGHGHNDCAKYDCEGGDHCDGYTVNAAYYTGREIEVPTETRYYNVGTAHEFSEVLAPDAEILRALVEDGLLTPACTVDTVEVDGETDMLYLSDMADGRPLLHLERVE